MAREGFVAYHEWLDSLAPLTDEECGRLFRACLQYSKTGEAPEPTGNERFLWPTFAQKIDKDRAAYEARCQTNKANRGKRPSTTDDETQRSSTIVIDRLPSLTIVNDRQRSSTTDNDRLRNAPTKPNQTKPNQTETKPKDTEREAQPPTLQEVTAYVAARGNKIDAARFYQFYSRSNFRTRTGPLDWQAKVVEWERTERSHPARQVTAAAYNARPPEVMTMDTFDALADKI